MLQGLSYQAVEHVVLVFSHTADSLTIDYMLDPRHVLLIYIFNLWDLYVEFHVGR